MDSDPEDQKGKYSAKAGNASAANRTYAIRRARENPANRRIVKAVLGMATLVRPFSLKAKILSEIAAIIRFRFGRFLPESDGTECFEAVAAVLARGGNTNLLKDLRGWCWNYAPWACAPSYADVLAEVADTVVRERRQPTADHLAHVLCLRMEERMLLGISTIGACDVSPAERQKIMRERKRTMDRERQQAKRQGDGRQARADYEATSLTRQKPWEAAGLSRASWYRLKKQGLETGLSKPCI